MVPKHLVWAQARGARLEGAIALGKALLATLIVGVLCANVWGWEGPFVHRVHRSEFIRDVAARGNVENAETVTLRCEVPSQGTGGTPVLRIVPEGSLVKAGELCYQ